MFLGTKNGKIQVSYFLPPLNLKIEEKRIEIDAIDKAILDLLNRRAAIAKDISLIKLSAGLPIVDQQREDEVLRRLTQANLGLIDDVAVARIYRIILDESRRIQSEIRADLATNGATR